MKTTWQGPIGWTRSGRPIWPIAGGSGDGAGDGGSGDGAGAGDGGDGGKQFTQADIDRIVADRLARERAKYSDYDDLKAKAGRLDQLEAQSKSDLDRAVEAARQEGEQAAAARLNGTVVRAEARSLAAAAKFRDPGDAVAFLDLTDIKVGDDGTVDGDAIKARLDDLAKAKPYLLATTTADFDGGARGGGSAEPSSKERAQALLSRMGYGSKT
jgi:hypothetical protein